jgi:hypothetical protein
MKLIVSALRVLELGCQIMEHLILLVFIVVIWVDKHVLVFIGQEIVLLNLSLLGVGCELAGLTFDVELWTLILIEGAVLVLMLALFIDNVI